MANVEARIKVNGKEYQIQVELEEALKIKEGKGDISAALTSQNIFHDLKKGTLVSKADLQSAFGTIDTFEIAKRIILKGEVQKTQEFRDEVRENKIKQVIAILVKNCSDQHGKPYTEERLRNAIKETHFNFDNRPPEQQVPELLKKLQEIIPIKLETKKIKLIIPARFIGQAYSLLKDLKESEEWLSNGDLETVLSVPSGTLIDFYEKLNNITHGAAQSKEIIG